MSDQVATCWVQISRKRRKTLLISFHLGVYRREVRHKIGSRVAFLSRLLCAARISASTMEALLTFPVTWRPNPTRIERTCRFRWEWVNDVFYCTRKRQSFQQSDEQWNNDIDCISQHNLPFLATSGPRHLSVSHVTVKQFCREERRFQYRYDQLFLWSEKAGLCLHRFLAYVSSCLLRLVVFLSLFLLRKYWDKIRKIILKSAKRGPTIRNLKGRAWQHCKNLSSLLHPSIGWAGRRRPPYSRTSTRARSAIFPIFFEKFGDRGPVTIPGYAWMWRKKFFKRKHDARESTIRISKHEKS